MSAAHAWPVVTIRDGKLTFVYDDGGRKEAGYKGNAGDCVTRSIAIATGVEYQQVYDDLKALAKTERITKRRKKQSSVRDGVHKDTTRRYLESIGWRFVPTMTIGSGCRVHLKAEELPKGRLIVKVTKHLTTVIDGVIHDTFDPSRNGTRCVYGYYTKEQS